MRQELFYGIVVGGNCVKTGVIVGREVGVNNAHWILARFNSRTKPYPSAERTLGSRVRKDIY